MDARPILTFDTSAINKLAKDPDSEASEALVAGLRSGFFVRLSFTSVEEVVATTSGECRRMLLDVCRRLVSSGDCIDPTGEILRKMVAHFEGGPPFDWRTICVRLPEAEREIARLENFPDDLAKKVRAEQQISDEAFDKVYNDAKPHFARLFAPGTGRVPGSASELVARLQETFWRTARNLYARYAKNHTDETTIRRFVKQCDPFHALLVAFFAAAYDRCVRPQNVGPSFKSDSGDTLMAVCLPYCHQFVTNDAGQLACYSEVVSLVGLGVTVRSYEEFRSTLCLA